MKSGQSCRAGRAAIATLLAFALGAAHAQQDSVAQSAGPAISTSATTAAAAPIQPESQCLDPTRILRWKRLDAHTVAVLARNDRYFELRFAADCSADRNKPSAWQMSSQAPARLCGYAGETAISAQGDMCGIASMKRLDRAQYETLLGTGKD